jgi:hypothetical protein
MSARAQGESVLNDYRMCCSVSYRCVLICFAQVLQRHFVCSNTYHPSFAALILPLLIVFDSVSANGERNFYLLRFTSSVMFQTRVWC